MKSKSMKTTKTNQEERMMERKEIIVRYAKKSYLMAQKEEETAVDIMDIKYAEGQKKGFYYAWDIMETFEDETKIKELLVVNMAALEASSVRTARKDGELAALGEISNIL